MREINVVSVFVLVLALFAHASASAPTTRDKDISLPAPNPKIQDLLNSMTGSNNARGMYPSMEDLARMKLDSNIRNDELVSQMLVFLVKLNGLKGT